jgi:hypothetical protein
VRGDSRVEEGGREGERERERERESGFYKRGSLARKPSTLFDADVLVSVSKEDR